MKCNGTLKEKTVEHMEFGVPLGMFKALGTSCGEVFYDSAAVDEIRRKSKQRGLFGLAKRTKVAQVGNSFAIPIPQGIVQCIHLKKKDKVKIIPKTVKE